MKADWPSFRLGEVADVQVGYAFKSAQFTNDQADPRLLRGINVGQGVIDWGSTRHWPRDVIAGLEKYWLSEGDVILAMDRPWIPGGLKYGVVRGADLPALLVQRVARLRGGAKLDTSYLFYLIGSKSFTEYVLAVQTGTTIPHISATQISAFTSSLPPVDIQRQIASILRALDDKIELNRRMSETLEEISATHFKAWWHAARNPEGTLADIIEFDPPERLKRGIEAPYLGLAHIPSSGLIHEAPDDRAFTSGSRFRDGDTLFARITPSLENGKTAIALGLGDGVIAWGSTELIVMRPREFVPVLIPYLISRDPAFRAHAVQNMSGTSGRQRVAREALMRYAFPVTSRQEWLHLDQIMAPSVQAIWARAQESRTLAELRDALLPKLISGELRIPEAEQLVSEVV